MAEAGNIPGSGNEKRRKSTTRGKNILFLHLFCFEFCKADPGIGGETPIQSSRDEYIVRLKKGQGGNLSLFHYVQLVDLPTNLE